MLTDSFRSCGRVLAPAAALWAFVTLPTVTVPTAAAQERSYSVPSELTVAAADPATGLAQAPGRARVSGGWRDVLGTTGRIPLARREVYVGRGGRVFVVARVPDHLAGSSHDLDVYFREAGVWQLRAQMRYNAGAPTLVSKTLVFPGMPEGPVMTEVHARGAHEARWEDLTSVPFSVPDGGRLRFGYALDGVDPDSSSAVELSLEAAPVQPGTFRRGPVTLWSEQVSASSTEPRWVEEDVSLRRVAGSEVVLRFRSRPVDDGGGPSPGVVWGVPRISYARERSAFPVFVVLSLDGLRADSLGLYGAENSQTPFLDEFFGSKGGVVEDAVTQAVTTQAAHASLFTSLNPCMHGALATSQTIAPNLPSLTEAISAAGYRTAAFTEGGALAAKLGFGRGFDHYDEGGSWTRLPPEMPVTAVERALDWLRKQDQGPIFVFIHTYQTRPFSWSSATGPASSARSRYRAQLRAADERLRTFFDELDRITVASKSTFVVTSGHGSAFFERGIGGHGTELYDTTTRIPMLFRGAKIRSGRRHDLTVGMIDLAPTLIDLVGGSVPEGMRGRSFADALGGGRPPHMPHRFVEAHARARRRQDGSLSPWTPPAFAVREAGHKVTMHVATGGLPEFEAYDLGVDPGEVQNLFNVSRPPEWATRLKRVVQNYPMVCDRLGARSGPAPALDSVDRAKLRALGYQP